MFGKGRDERRGRALPWRRMHTRYDHLPRLLLSLSLIAMLLASYGQPQVRFVDPPALDLRHRLGNWKEAQASMEASGLSPTQRMVIVAGSDTRLWPPAITTQPASATTQPYLRNYVLFEVFRFQQDGRERVVALMPVLDNLHMPDDMRPLGDIHLVLFSDGVEAVASGLRPKPPIREPHWDTLPKVRVREPAGLFATYQLLQDHEARRVLAAAGMDERAISLIAYRSHEKQWPTGMSSFDSRYPRIRKLRKLRVAEVARWDDKVLLLAPAARNRHLPKAMRPLFDLYLVYSASAIGSG